MKVFLKKLILALLGTLLVSMIGSECFGVGRYYCPIHKVFYSELGSHGGTKCSNSGVSGTNAKYYCTVHNKFYYKQGEHGGTKCQRQNNVVLGSKTKVINMDVREYASNNSYGRSSNSFFSLNIQSNVWKQPYWPSRRRLIYLNNVYSGRQIHYLGGNWGWGDSRSRRHGGHHGHVR